MKFVFFTDEFDPLCLEPDQKRFHSKVLRALTSCENLSKLYVRLLLK